MKFLDPLVAGYLVRRYKRFLADVRLDDGREVTAHCANPGSMLGLNEPGIRVWLSPARNPARKLRWSWELAYVDDGLVGINTTHPNTIVAEAIEAGRVTQLAAYPKLRREVKYGRNSRIDLLLEGDKGCCYVEIKNVHLKRDAGAEFPDSVTARGAKHLAELMDVVAAGHRAVLFYLVQRTDCTDFRVAADIDPAYNAAFVEAQARGVESVCYSCAISTEAIVLDRQLPIR